MWHVGALEWSGASCASNWYKTWTKSGDGVIEGSCCALTAGRVKPPPGARQSTHVPCRRTCRALVLQVRSHNSKGRRLQRAPKPLMGSVLCADEAKVIRYHLHSVRPAMGRDCRDGHVVGGRDDAASMAASAIPELGVAQSTQCLTLAYESHTSCE